jgi:predicted nucleic acid-binding protein
MARKKPRVFLDTSVLFSAVLSETGGARKLFHLGEAGLLQLLMGPTVLAEADEVVRRKVPASLPVLARLLDAGQVETTLPPLPKHIESAQKLVAYIPDARVFAEAIRAEVDWFLTHDKEHFLKQISRVDVAFEIGTPGDFLQRLKDDFYLP